MDLKISCGVARVGHHVAVVLAALLDAVDHRGQHGALSRVLLPAQVTREPHHVDARDRALQAEGVVGSAGAAVPSEAGSGPAPTLLLP